MKRLRLLATDFDGTLLGEPKDGRETYAFFRQQLRHFRYRYGMKWAVVTGRHIATIPAVVGELLIHGLVPDFLVMEDACIYRRAGGRYWPFWWWNLGLNLRRKRQVRRHRTHILALAKTTMERFPGAENLTGKRMLDFWFRFPNEAQAREVEQELQGEFKGNVDFFIFRWDCEVCLAPTAGTKADALTKLEKTLGIRPEEVAAIGDGQNDVSMLDRRYCGYPGCVDNASGPVKEVVIGTGGYVANLSVMMGVVEFMDFLQRDLTDDGSSRKPGAGV